MNKLESKGEGILNLLLWMEYFKTSLIFPICVCRKSGVIQDSFNITTHYYYHHLYTTQGTDTSITSSFIHDNYTL